MKKQIIKRGEIYFADLRNTVGSEQGGMRPVVVIQNDVGNLNSPTTIIIPITSRKQKNPMPTHVKIESADIFKKESIALTEQIRVIDRSRLKYCMGRLSQKDIVRIESAIALSLGLNNIIIK